jgi:glucuronoarabinoxylan endo-1,4-beta-xylanase
MNFKVVSSIIISLLVIAYCSRNDSITGPSNSILPADVTELQIVMADSSVTLTWVNPADSVYNHIEITFTPAAAGITQPIIVSKPVETKTITGLVNGTQYTFIVKAVDDEGNKSIGISQSIILIPNAAIIYLNNVKQIIRGFGGVNMPGWTDVGDLTTDQVEKAFGTGEDQIGMTILRTRVPYDSTQFYLEVLTAKLAKSLGAIIMATPWSPPPSMKSNNDIVGGELNPDSYADFANYLRSFADYMSNNGASLYAVSVQNEPDVHVGYESCDWNAEQLLNFVKNNAPAVGTKIIAPESYKFDHALSDPILNDPVAAANVSIVGGHIYGDSALASYPLALSKSKEIWMTEHIVECNAMPYAFDVAKEINDCMNAGMSAYLLWYIRRAYGPINETGFISKGGYYMSQYARFVRPGFYRVGVTAHPQNHIDITAYRNGSVIVIVALNKASTSISQTFIIQNGTPVAFTPYITSASENCIKKNDILVSESNFTVVLGPMRVTTFVSN